MARSDFRDQLKIEYPHYRFYSLHSSPCANYCSLRIYESSFSILSVIHSLASFSTLSSSCLFDTLLSIILAHFLAHKSASRTGAHVAVRDSADRGTAAR